MRIAVIGHGRSPEDRGWGKKIDACDLVLRMWDWEWQAAADCGRRYDHGVVALDQRQLEAWRRRHSATPAVSWLGFMRDGLPAHPAMEPLDPARWNEIAAKLRTPGKSRTFNLTRGCAAVCWAIKRAGADGDVVLVGFDNLRRGRLLPEEEAFGPAYLAHYDAAYPDWRRWSGYQAGETRCGSHDIAVERQLLGVLCAETGNTLTFAEDLWP